MNAFAERRPGIMPVAVALLALAWGGCASGRGDGRQRLPAQPLLFGQQAYFEGAVQVEAALGPFRLNSPRGALDRTPPEPGEGEPIPVRNGGFGGRAEREAGTGFPRGPAEAGAFGGTEGFGATRSRPGSAWMAGGPRQTLSVTVRSLADAPVRVRVVEVKSALGNFVPVPEQFTLEPGASQELEAMRASYPDAIDELELLVILRVGGREETHVLKLKLAAPAATVR